MANGHYYTYGYDSTTGNLKRVDVQNTGRNGFITYSYDLFERMTSKTVDFTEGVPQGFYNEITYDFLHEIEGAHYNESVLISQYKSTVKKHSTATTGVTTTYNYTYDDRGNITEIRDADGLIQYRYHYDDLGQLTREDNRAKNQTYIYTYDNAGNITSKKTHALSMGAILEAEVSTVAYTYGNASWGDLLTKYGSTSIRYDTIGNPTRIGSTDLFWRGRELMSWEDDYYRTTYTYNADGIRTSKEEYEFGEDYVERTEYMLNGSQIIGETVYFSQDGGVTFTEQYTLIYLYDESSTPIGMMYRTPSYSDYAFDYYFFEKNLQGDIVAIYNASGTKIGSYTYDAWGKCTATSNTSGYNTILHANPFRYRGYYYDSETGFYYLQSRYYNPTWGRFLNADGQLNPGILGYNMFAYCNNNPVMGTDETGHGWLGSIIGGTIGAITGGLFGAFNAALSGDNVWKGFISGAISGAFSGAITGSIAEDIATFGLTSGQTVLAYAIVELSSFLIGSTTELANQCISGEEINCKKIIQTGVEMAFFSTVSLTVPWVNGTESAIILGNAVLGLVYNLVTSTVSILGNAIFDTFACDEDTGSNYADEVIQIYD